jgi:PIN domain nuclease of toxin-antitoxin system
MTYLLDTNAVIWLYEGDLDRFTKETKLVLEQNDLFVSPFVKLELQYLFEVEKIRISADKIFQSLYDSIGVQIQNVPLTVLIEAALHESWTRDPFDRLITAHSRLENAFLITKDKFIRAHYSKAIW